MGKKGGRGGREGREEEKGRKGGRERRREGEGGREKSFVHLKMREGLIFAAYISIQNLRISSGLFVRDQTTKIFTHLLPLLSVTNDLKCIV